MHTKNPVVNNENRSIFKLSINVTPVDAVVAGVDNVVVMVVVVVAVVVVSMLVEGTISVVIS